MALPQDYAISALTGKKGDNGTPAKFVELESPNGNVFKNGSPSSLTLNAHVIGFTPAANSYVWKKDGTTISGQTSSSLTVTTAGVYSVTVGGCTDSVTVIAVSDGQNGTSPYACSVSNENFTIATDVELKPLSGGNYDVVFTAYKGTTQLSAVASNPGSGQFSISSPAGFTKRSDNKTLRFTASSSTAIPENASFDVTVTFEGTTVEVKTITISAAKAGEDGEDGKNAVVMTSATTPSGEYEGQVGIWQNQIYFWTNGAWVNQTPELPTDAVLHYSFDEVPDLPDGNADVRLLDNNTYDIQSNNSFKFNITRGTTAVNTNGNLELQMQGTSSSGNNYINNTNIANKVIKIVFEITEITAGEIRFRNNPNTPIVLTSIGKYEYTYNNGTNNRCTIYTPNGSSGKVIIKQIYIGDGSYSTPIIDNANGQNAVNNGGITVQGVSGKGAYFLNGKYAYIGTDLQLSPNFSVSLWVNPDNDTTDLNGTLVDFVNQFSLRNGYAVNKLEVNLFDRNGNSLISNGIARDLMPANKWSHIVVTRDGVHLRVFVDGIRVIIFTLNNSTIGKATGAYLSSSFLSRPQSIDDLLIFDRALSEQEVLALYQNKANTPKYFTMSDYSLEQIDDDNVVDHLTEKPQLLSKWLEIYNAKNVSSALPTSNVSTNGEYKGVINTANEVGVISTEQLENYIQATNALRSALWGTNGYLVDMNTDSTLNGNLDTLFANYRETLQIARTQITKQQASIASALSVVNSNPFQLIPVDSQSVVITGGYDNTGTRLQVYNGTTVLTPKSASSTLSNGEWKVTANGSGIVAGSQTVGTGDNKYIDFGNVSNLSAETAVITYTINVMLNNTLNTIYVVQKFGKSKEGTDGRIYSLLPDFTAVKKSADGSVLTPSSVTVQAKSWTGSSIPEPYNDGDLKAFENNVQVGTTVHGNSITVTPTGNYPVVVNLYRHGTNTLIDTVTIPILQEVKGDQGEAGLTWFSGNSINGYDTNGRVYSGSGISNARIGDFYLNTDTQDIYECVLGGNARTALWKWNGNLTSDENTNLIRFNPFTPITSVANKVYSVIEEADAPWGGTTDVMKCFRTGEVTTQWLSIMKNWSKTPIDTSKKYRFSVFFKQITTASNISNYFGAGIQTDANYVASLGSDTGNTNFYFTSFSTYREKERWYLLVAHIHPFDTTRTTADDDSGIYDALTGEKLSNVNDCKWMENAPSVFIRNMYVDKTTASSNPDSAVEQWFCSPRIDICNGLQPSVKDLLNGNFHTTEWYSGTAITGTSTTRTVFSGSGISWAVKGDKYLNTDTNNLYECTYSGSPTVANWVYQMNIKGDTGDDGTLTFVSDQTRSWTDSQWNDYSTAGRVTSWNNSTVEGMRVGDILQIPATLTQQGNITGVVYARITSIPTTKSGGLYQIPTVTLYGQKGNKGDKGDTGVGITAVTEYYLRNNSSTAPAFDESTLSNWSTSASNPINTAQYLWNAERITKSDGTTTTYEYMTPHLAMKYTANGTDGQGIVSIKNYYLATSLDSGVTTETQGWTEAVQTVSSTNRYLWNYEEIIYTTGNPTKTSPAIIGTFGAVSQGNWTPSHSYKVSDIVYYQGSSYICKTAHTSGSTFDSSKWNKLADKGGDNKSVTVLLSNQNPNVTSNSDGSSPVLTNTVTDIRVYENETELKYDASSTSNGYYKVTVTASGCTHSSITDKGDYAQVNAISAMSADNATRTFAISGKRSDGTTFSFSAVQTITKSKKGNKGDTGVGITAVTEYYLRNNSSTAPTFNESTLSNWSTSASNPISTAQYLWNAERITKSDGTTTTYEYMTPHLAMKYTANGTDGKGIVSIKNYYLASSLDSGVTTETQGWTEAVQTVSSTNRYLWNYEEIIYTTGNPTKTSPAIIGTFGAVSQGNWTPSHSYKVSDIVYYQGSSYICKTAHTSGSTFDSSKWNKLADKGGDGKGVVSVIAYTALSTDTTKPAQSAFTTTAKSVDSTNRYLWRYEVTTYTDDSTTGSYADATIIGVWGNSGIDATAVSISSEQIEVMCGNGNGKFLGSQTQRIIVYARKGSAKKACTLSFTSPASGTGITITKQNGTASADGYFNITFADNGNLGGDSTNSYDLSLTVTVDTIPFVFTVKAIKASKGVYLGRCASKPSTATVTVYTGDTWNGSSVTKYALKGDYVSVVNMTESDSNRGKMFQWNGSSWNEDGNTGHAMEALDDMLLMSDTLPDGSRATKFLDRLITNEVLAKRMTSLEVMFKEFVASFKGSNYEQGDLSISMGKNPKNLYDDNLNFNIQSFLAMLPKSSTSSEHSEMWRKEFYTEYDDVYKKTDLVTKGDISLGGALKTFDTVYGGANVEEQPFIYPDSFTSNDTVVFSVRQDMLRMFRCSNGTIYVYIGVLPSVQDQLAFSLLYTWNGNINQIYDIYQTYTEGQGFTEYISTSEGVYRYKDTESERFSLVVDKVFIRMNPYKGKVICWDDASEESFLFDGTNLTQIDVIGDVFVEFTENLYVGYAKYSTNPIIEFYNCNEDGFNRVGYNNLQGKPIYNIDAYTHKRGNSAGSINKNNIYGLYAVNGKLYLSYDTTVTAGKACMILRSNDCGNTWDIISSTVSTDSASTNSSRFLFGYNKDGLIVLCGSGTYSYSTNNGEKFTIKTVALSSWKWTGRSIEDFGQNSRDILIPYWSSGLKFKKLINVNTAEIFKKNISNQKGNFIKFRNGDGFVIQWGQTENLGNASSGVTKTAPISLGNRPFFNNNYSVFVTLEGSTSGLELAVKDKTRTGFTITGYNRNSSTPVNDVVFHWFAIGNTDK